jgi:SAM-dependent methyltransferase
MKPLPEGTVRGDVAAFLARHRSKLSGPVLELGSRLPSPTATWANNRHLLPGAEWVGVDMQPGPNVDCVHDAERLPPDWNGSYGSVICSEVLEHTRRPWAVLAEAHRVLKPASWILVTVPFCFHVHAYPDDYWRMTPSCLTLLLREAGFVEVTVEECGKMPLVLNNHGTSQVTKFAPRHVFAVGRTASRPAESARSATA